MCNKMPYCTYVLFMFLLFSKCVFSNKLNCKSYKKGFATIKSTYSTDSAKQSTYITNSAKQSTYITDSAKQSTYITDSAKQK